MKIEIQNPPFMAAESHQLRDLPIEPFFFLKIKAELKKLKINNSREKRMQGAVFPGRKAIVKLIVFFNPGRVKEDTFPTRPITPLEPIFPNTEERKSLGLRALQSVMPRLRGERLLPIEKS